MTRLIGPADLTVAILAGGAGTRLGGGDKGWVLLAGKPLVAHAVSALRSQAAELLIIANRNVDDYSTFSRTIGDPTLGFAGPLAGVTAALIDCTTAWLITAPVDCPSPPADLAARLANAARACEGDAFVAHDGERRQPLFALYRRELAKPAQIALEAGQGVWQWQTSIAAREVDFSDECRHFVNLNSAEDVIAYVDP